MIVRQLKIGPDSECCYLVGCEEKKEAVVIDPPGGIETILAESRQEALTIRYIFNTHHHADHTAGNRALHQATLAPILIHKLEVPALRRRINLGKLWFGKFSRSPVPDIIIDKETEFRVGNIRFTILLTPGHTPGGLCFHTQGHVFTGDTLFVGDSGATHLPGGDRTALGASLKRLFSLLPDDTIIWPGHDYGDTPTSTIGREKRTNKNAVEYGFYRA